MQDKAVVVQPDEGRSFWQPVPANGYVELKVIEQAGGNRFDCGMQSVAAGGFVREHAHSDHNELILVYQGSGKALINGEEHIMQPGTALYLKPEHSHKFVNTGDEELRFFWVLMPGGLSEFFQTIGRERAPGEDAPEPFARPENIAEIEARTVFAGLKPDATAK